MSCVVRYPECPSGANISVGLVLRSWLIVELLGRSIFVSTGEVFSSGAPK